MATLRLNVDPTGAVTGAQRAEDALQNVVTQARVTEAATTQLGNRMAPAMAGGAMHTANLAAQFNDIGVMLGSGQSPLILAIQQGTQINQVLDQMRASGQSSGRALITAFTSIISPANLATIGIIAAGAALGQWALSAIGAGEEALTLDERIENLADSMKEYKDLIDGATASTEDLTAKFGDQAEAAREVFRILAENKRMQLEVEAGALAAEARSGLGAEGVLAGLQTQQVADFFNVERDFLVFSESAREARDQFDAMAQAALDAQARMANASGIEAQIDAAQEALTTFVQLADLDGERSQSEREYVTALGETILKLQELQQIDAQLEEGMMRSGQSIGENIVDGVVAGIEGQTPEAEGAAADMAAAVASAAREALDIRSPSRVMHEIGQFVIEGLVGGISEGQDSAIDAMQSVADTMTNTFSSGLRAMTDGTKTAKEAFRDMASDIIAQLYDILVVQQLVGNFNATTGGGSGIVGFLGGLFTGARAEGGMVRRGESYLVGERGPEIIRPASDGRVMANGDGGGVTINQTIQVTTGVQSTVRAEIMQLMPRIAEASKAAVMDARQRGGSFAGAF